MRRHILAVIMLGLGMLACVRSQPEYVVVTATFVPEVHQGAATAAAPLQVSPQIGREGQISPTPDPTSGIVVAAGGREYTVQAGDTLIGIANANGVSLQALLEINPLVDPNIIAVGQVIQLPEAPTQFTSEIKLLADSRLVRAPGSAAFNVAAFIEQQPGFIRAATDEVDEQRLSAAQIVERVSLEFSTDARLLLALLEHRSGWLTNPDPAEPQKDYPLGAPASSLGFDRKGLYRQLTWAADQLNRGYYGWKYRSLSVLEFDDGTRLAFGPGLNAATVGLQFMLGQNTSYSDWLRQVSAEGFQQTYRNVFGDPFAAAVDPLVPLGLEQPLMTLPFGSGETWFYTGGPHGGWGSGSAWAAIDFAPPDERPDNSPACYLSNSWVTAVAPGIIARTDEGVVILDLDGDGDESTGWSVLYLHIAAQDRIEPRTWVEAGDRIGRPSCEGGFSNGTHMHIARRYNGEWIPADCSECPTEQMKPSFELGGWTVRGIAGQEYQGFLVNGGDRRIAEQGRTTPDNHVAW